MLISSDAVFDCLAQWHRCTSASAMLEKNIFAMTLLASSNASPHSVRPAPPHATELIAHNDSVKKLLQMPEPLPPPAQLLIFTSCCQQLTMVAEKERLALAATPSTLLFSDGVAEEVGKKRPRSALLIREEQQHVREELLRRSHTSTCCWRGHEVCQMVLHPSSLRVEESIFLRSRCAAVRVDANTSSSSSGAASSTVLLLPRGLPPSQLQREVPSSSTVFTTAVAELHADQTEEEREMMRMMMAELNGLRWVSCSVAIPILAVLFCPKERRAELSAATTSNNNNGAVDVPEELRELTQQHLLILLRMYGFVLHEKLMKDVGDDDDNDALPGWVIRCRYCGAAPRTSIQHSLANQHTSATEEADVAADACATEQHTSATLGEDGGGCTSSASKSPVRDENDAEADDEHARQPSQQRSDTPTEVGEEEGEEEVAGVDGDATTMAEMHIGHAAWCNQHHDGCPWHKLFVQPLLGDETHATTTTTTTTTTTSSSSSSSSLMDFTFEELRAGEPTGHSLRLCFIRPEVQRLISCWRASEMAEQHSFVEYLHPHAPQHVGRTLNELPAILRNAAVEAFLEQKQKKQHGKALDVPPPPPRRAMCFSTTAANMMESAAMLLHRLQHTQSQQDDLPRRLMAVTKEERAAGTNVAEVAQELLHGFTKEADRTERRKHRRQRHIMWMKMMDVCRQREAANGATKMSHVQNVLAHIATSSINNNNTTTTSANHDVAAQRYGQSFANAVQRVRDASIVVPPPPKPTPIPTTTAPPPTTTRASPPAPTSSSSTVPHAAVLQPTHVMGAPPAAFDSPFGTHMEEPPRMPRVVVGVAGSSPQRLAQQQQQQHVPQQKQQVRPQGSSVLGDGVAAVLPTPRRGGGGILGPPRQANRPAPPQESAGGVVSGGGGVLPTPTAARGRGGARRRGSQRGGGGGGGGASPPGRGRAGGRGGGAR